MFVLLSKTLDLMVSPVSWVLLLMVVALLARRRAAASGVLGVLAIGVLSVFSMPRVANALMESLESSAQTTMRPGVYDAVIVLSGMVDETSSARSGRSELNTAGDRILAGFEILREGKARQILLTGGPVSPRDGVPTEPEWLAASLRRWGVDPARIVIETRSRNTHENAVESARVVAERGWRSLLLVTSANHMTRAVECFRKAGLNPDTYPVDWRGDHDSGSWVPRARALELSESALRELTGRWVYRIAGYS